MEIIGLYSVFDKKANRYDTPFFALNDLFAERRFVVWYDKDESIFKKFKNDFELRKIAEFNVIDGKIKEDIKTVLEGIQIDTDKGGNGS